MKFFRNIIEKIKGKREKYGIKPEENIPREVYGVARPPKNERDQYNIKPERNIPAKVYGIPRPDEDNKQEIIKEVVLNINHQNWGEMGPNSWVSTEWKIYNDLSFQKTEAFRKEDGFANEYKTYNGIINKELYEKIIENLELAKTIDLQVDACDGSAWEFIQYKGLEVWKRELGYIYGIKPLEEITKILSNL